MNNTSKEKKSNENQNQNQNENPISSKLKKILGQEVPSEELNSKELDTMEMLQEIYRNTSSGLFSVEILKPYIKDKTLKNLLYGQYNEYKKLSKEIELSAANQEIDIKPINKIRIQLSFLSFFFVITHNCLLECLWFLFKCRHKLYKVLSFGIS
jgi:hypothetical protein